MASCNPIAPIARLTWAGIALERTIAMPTYRAITPTITLRSDDDLRTNPLSPTWVVVTGSIEGLSLNDLITRETGTLAYVRETTWQAVDEGHDDEQIAAVQWLCESCLVLGIRFAAVTQRNGEHVCQDCADDIDDRDIHHR